jgi:hypothetical protein
MTTPICFKLDAHAARFDAARARLIDGRRMLTSNPMIAITTRISTSVNALRLFTMPLSTTMPPA